MAQKRLHNPKCPANHSVISKNIYIYSNKLQERRWHHEIFPPSNHSVQPQTQILTVLREPVVLSVLKHTWVGLVCLCLIQALSILPTVNNHHMMLYVVSSTWIISKHPLSHFKKLVYSEYKPMQYNITDAGHTNAQH